MKIGILTFHYCDNYGAVLQAVALQQTLKNLGHEVVFINYNPEADVTLHRAPVSFSVRIKRLLLALIKRVRFFRYRAALRSQREVFRSFRRENLAETRRYDDNAQLALDVPGVDAFVVGSDQVWLMPPIPAYFLEFLGQSRVRRVAYAASSNRSSIPEGEREHVRALLRNFDRISTREAALMRSVNALAEKPAVAVVDPVLLQPPSFWRQYAREPLVAEPYMLVYVMKPRRNFVEIVRECKRRLQLPVVVLVAEGALVNTLGLPADRIFVEAGPAQFVNLVAHARFMCTSSFHGTAFSLLMHTPFLSYTHDRSDERISNILKAAGMEAFHVCAPGEVGEIAAGKYDFARSDAAIEKLAAEGAAFLKAALS